jgi:hypothetical protein
LALVLLVCLAALLPVLGLGLFAGLGPNRHGLQLGEGGLSALLHSERW